MEKTQHKLDELKVELDKLLAERTAFIRCEDMKCHSELSKGRNYIRNPVSSDLARNISLIRRRITYQEEKLSGKTAERYSKNKEKLIMRQKNMYVTNKLNKGKKSNKDQ